MVADEQRKALLAHKVAAALGDVIVRRDEVKEQDGGRTLHDYILQRHVGTATAQNPSRLTRVESAAVAEARVAHEKRGGAPLPRQKGAAMKVGATAARVQHDRLGGAPLPPLKRR